jgi:hypothetical protein
VKDWKVGVKMRLDKLAKIIYEKGTASEHREILVKDQHKVILWHGKAKDLYAFAAGKSWSVLEIVVDRNAPNENIPDYNKGKIITVY